MGVPGNANALLLVQAAAAGGYTIGRSVRLNPSDSAYFNKTFGSAGNRKTYTLSAWIKLCSISSNQYYLMASGNTYICFTSSAQIEINLRSGATNYFSTSNQVFRDFSAWQHIVWSVNTASSAMEVYINGSAITWSSKSVPNADTDINRAANHNIGKSDLDPRYFDGYLADVHFIDGQALDPTSFGEFDATTGVWNPIAYTGSYGTNGFHLDFADNSSAAALGYDAAGSNDWTVNNLSVTAGAGNDSLRDSPTNGDTANDTGLGGELPGNYCTWNPLKTGDTTSLAQGNLFWRTTSNAPDRCVLATIGMPSGKWYWECYMDEGTATAIGVALDSVTLTSGGAGSNSYVYYSANGAYYNSGSSAGSGSTFTTGDLIGVAFDADTGKLWFAKNGTWQGSGDPGAGTNPAMTLTTGLTYFPLAGDSGGASQSQVTANFGQRAFAYTNNRSGFKALCTANLPTPTIEDPSTVMDVKLYTGTNSTLNITGLGFSPDFLWIKNRASAANHALVDIVRGASKQLQSSTTNAESTNSSGKGVQTFNSDGFTLGQESDAVGGTNDNTAGQNSYVAWCWDAGSSTVSNTDGSITSSVRANASAGFSIITGTGNGSFGHGLGVTPAMYIIKDRLNSGTGWWVNHRGLSNQSDQYLGLHSTSAVQTTSWGGSPTSTIAYVANAFVGSSSWVCYAFAPVAGYSAFGSYTGNGSSDGPFVYTGHRSRWVMIKRTDSAGNWGIYDTARDPENVQELTLLADTSGSESTDANKIDIVSNGFKARASNANVNASGATYVFAAFAESPFAYSRAR